MTSRITLRSLLGILLTLAVLPLWALDREAAGPLPVGAAIIYNVDSLLPVRNSYFGKEELIARFRYKDIPAGNENLASLNGTLTSQNGTPTSQNGTLASQNGTPTSRNGNLASQNGTPTSRNGIPTSLNGILASRNGIPTSQSESVTSPNEELVSDLLNAETDYKTTGNGRRALVRLLKIVRVNRNHWDTRSGARLFSDLANVSVKLKLYSLAMKCYYKATQYTDGPLFPGYRKTVTGFSGDGEEDEDDNTLVDSLSFNKWVSSDTASGAPAFTDGIVKSEPIKTSGIWKSFDDGKTAVSYALILHAKQPVSGKRKSFTHINNVGHLFVTLIKYNDDNTFVSRSFGFYPRKTTIFSATPLHPGSASVFKDDAQHEWDEIAGKFISEKRFQKIIELVKRYDHLTYNLNRNNCTDFGLNVAAIGGISISQTIGTWPLGRGNNPANAGQSMLEGKVKNIDPDYQGPLFSCSNVLSH